MFQWLKNLFTSNKKSKPAKLWESGAGPKTLDWDQVQSSMNRAAVRGAEMANRKSTLYFVPKYQSAISYGSNRQMGYSNRSDYDAGIDPLLLMYAANPELMYVADVVEDSCTVTTAKYDETNDRVVLQDSSTHRYESSCTPSYDSPSYSSSSYDSGSSSSYSSCDSSSSAAGSVVLIGEPI